MIATSSFLAITPVPLEKWRRIAGQSRRGPARIENARSPSACHQTEADSPSAVPRKNDRIAGARALEHLRLALAEVQMATVRQPGLACQPESFIFLR
jgi:hypothetical protein